MIAEKDLRDVPMLDVRVRRLRHFGPREGATFCLITTPELAPRFRLVEPDGYAATLVLSCADGDRFLELLQKDVPETAHVLVVAPTFYFQSPSPEDLGPRRKLAVMACNSTQTSVEAIRHFLAMGERSDPERQERIAGRFFERGQNAKRILLSDQSTAPRPASSTWTTSINGKSSSESWNGAVSSSSPPARSVASSFRSTPNGWTAG